MTPSPGSVSEPAGSSAFTRLHPRMQRWIYERGWTSLHDAQERAIGPILDGDRDVIIAAATAGREDRGGLPADPVGALLRHRTGCAHRTGPVGGPRPVGGTGDRSCRRGAGAVPVAAESVDQRPAPTPGTAVRTGRNPGAPLAWRRRGVFETEVADRPVRSAAHHPRVAGGDIRQPWHPRSGSLRPGYGTS